MIWFNLTLISYKFYILHIYILVQQQDQARFFPLSFQLTAWAMLFETSQIERLYQAVFGVGPLKIQRYF